MMVEWMVSSCVTICFVVLVRFLFRKKMQPRIRYALWLVVALRLLTPVFVSTAAVSILNLLPEPAIEETRRTEGQAMLPGTDRAGEQDAGGLSILEDNTAVSVAETPTEPLTDKGEEQDDCEEETAESQTETQDDEDETEDTSDIDVLR